MDKNRRIVEINKEIVALAKEREQLLSEKKIDSIEERLFTKIYVWGKGVRASVEEVAKENYESGEGAASVARIWEYYKKLKEKLEQD